MRLPMKYALADSKIKTKKVLATMADQTKISANEYAPDPNTGKAEGGTSIYQDRTVSDNPYS